MLVNSKLFNFCCKVLGKDIINSKFFSYYDKLKLIARCSFERFLIIPDLFEKFDITYINPVDNTYIYVTTIDYKNFLDSYLKHGYEIDKLKIFIVIDDNQKYDDEPYLYKYTKNFIDFIYNTTEVGTTVKMDFWGAFTPNDVYRDNFNKYFTLYYSNFFYGYGMNNDLTFEILKNNPFICSDKIFIKIKDDYYFNDIDKVIYLLIEQYEKKLRQNFYNKEYLKL